jgi:hypothetical protein
MAPYRFSDRFQVFGRASPPSIPKKARLGLARFGLKLFSQLLAQNTAPLTFLSINSF